MPDAWNPLRRSPLHTRLREAGAVFETESGWTRARHFGDPEAEFQAGSTGVALSDLSGDREVAGQGPAPGTRS